MACILGGVKSGRLYQLSPRYYAANRKPVFVQILGRGILVLIHYGDWFFREKTICLKQNTTKFFGVLLEI